MLCGFKTLNDIIDEVVRDNKGITDYIVPVDQVKFRDGGGQAICVNIMKPNESNDVQLSLLTTRYTLIKMCEDIDYENPLSVDILSKKMDCDMAIRYFEYCQSKRRQLNRMQYCFIFRVGGGIIHSIGMWQVPEGENPISVPNGRSDYILSAVLASTINSRVGKGFTVYPAYSNDEGDIHLTIADRRQYIEPFNGVRIYKGVEYNIFRCNGFFSLRSAVKIIVEDREIANCDMMMRSSWYDYDRSELGDTITRFPYVCQAIPTGILAEGRVKEIGKFVPYHGMTGEFISRAKIFCSLIYKDIRHSEEWYKSIVSIADNSQLGYSNSEIKRVMTYFVQNKKNNGCLNYPKMFTDLGHAKYSPIDSIKFEEILSRLPFHHTSRARTSTKPLIKFNFKNIINAATPTNEQEA